jgi:hypothetical protein
VDNKENCHPMLNAISFLTLLILKINILATAEIKRSNPQSYGIYLKLTLKVKS